MSFIQSDVHDGVLTVRINRPEKRNALSQAVLGEIGETFTAHHDDAAVRVAVLSGAGERCFAAGGDLREFDTLREATELGAMHTFSLNAIDAIRNFSVPVIAALNGDAIGGGAELAVACDMRVFAAHARIAFVQANLCISPAWGGGADLTHLVGSAHALRLLSRADFIAGTEAEQLGIAQHVCHAEETFANQLEAFLTPVRKRPRQVMQAFKQLAMTARQTASWHAVRTLEPKLLQDTWLHDDHWTAADAVLRRISST